MRYPSGQDTTFSACFFCAHTIFQFWHFLALHKCSDEEVTSLAFRLLQLILRGYYQYQLFRSPLQSHYELRELLEQIAFYQDNFFLLAIFFWRFKQLFFSFEMNFDIIKIIASLIELQDYFCVDRIKENYEQIGYFNVRIFKVFRMIFIFKEAECS